MKKEMKIVLPFYKIAYAVSFVVILSVIRAVVFTYEIGLSIEPPFAILTAVFCADTYVQEITSNRSEVQRLYQIKKRIYSIIQRLMIQGTFLLLLAVHCRPDDGTTISGCPSSERGVRATSDEGKGKNAQLVQQLGRHQLYSS